MKKNIFLYCDRLEEFSYPSTCPFNISRAGKVYKTVKSMNLVGTSDRAVVAPAPADREVMEKLHSPEYLDAIKAAGQGHFESDMLHYGLGTGDCPVFEGMYEYAKLAVGATITGTEAILAGDANIAFNPSGGFHHAFAARAAGFCYINDSALACKLFADAGKKVLYLDVDVHHGDGVQYMFYDSSDVMTISMHQSGRTLFPGTGFVDEIGGGDGKGYSVNVPLPQGTYDQAYMKAFDQTVLPLAGKFAPDVIVMELGADALAGDPLAQLQLTNNVYAEVISLMLGFDKPIMAVGGGGYNVENTVRAWSLCWSALCGDDTEHANLGMGGVMMSTTDWHGGLRDGELAVDLQQKELVDPAIDQVIEQVKAKLFGLHGI
jgi:acetoin utilization protein AcuC